jgi:hypothetical protein
LGLERGEVKPDRIVGKVETLGEILNRTSPFAQKREDACARWVCGCRQSAAGISHLPEI